MKKEESKVKIIHHLRDGRIVDSIEGHVLEVNEKTKIAYRLLAESSRKA